MWHTATSWRLLTGCYTLPAQRGGQASQWRLDQGLRKFEELAAALERNADAASRALQRLESDMQRYGDAIAGSRQRAQARTPVPVRGVLACLFGGRSSTYRVQQRVAVTSRRQTTPAGMRQSASFCCGPSTTRYLEVSWRGVAMC